MAKLTCHASRLKGDDCRLKGLTTSHRACSNCDMYIVEDARHVFMQCPHNHDDMSVLYDEIATDCPNVDSVLKSEPDKGLMRLLG